MGEFGIQPRLVKPPEAEREEASQGDLGATMVYSATRAQRAARAAGAQARRAGAADDGRQDLRARPARARWWAAAAAATSSSTTRTSRGATSSCSGAATDWYVVDLESTNGIAVNGRRVPSAQLQPGDEIVAGTSRLRFNLD